MFNFISSAGIKEAFNVELKIKSPVTIESAVTDMVKDLKKRCENLNATLASELLDRVINSKTKINILVLEEDELNGFQGLTWQHTNKDIYVAFIAKTMTADLLIHELTHADQIIRGRLDLSGQTLLWDGEVGASPTGVNKDYLDFPWEVEAYEVQGSVLYPEELEVLNNFVKRVKG